MVDGNPVQSYHKYLKQKQKKKNLENKILQRQCNNLLSTPETLKKELSELQYKSLFKKLDAQEVKKLSNLECTYEQYLIKSQREQNELNERHTLDEQQSSDSSEESDESSIPIIITGKESDVVTNINTKENVKLEDKNELEAKEDKSNLSNKRLLTVNPVPPPPQKHIIKHNQGHGKNDIQMGFYRQPPPPPSDNTINKSSNIGIKRDQLINNRIINSKIQENSLLKKAKTSLNIPRNTPDLMRPIGRKDSINRLFEEARERRDMDEEFSNFMGEINNL